MTDSRDDTLAFQMAQCENTDETKGQRNNKTAVIIANANYFYFNYF